MNHRENDAPEQRPCACGHNRHDEYGGECYESGCKCRTWREPHLPTITEARERYIDGFPIDVWVVARDEVGQEFDRLIARVKAEAWDQGHNTPWRRNPDDGCTCGAWSHSECGCGRYGTGELLSLGDNPYREKP